MNDIYKKNNLFIYTLFLIIQNILYIFLNIVRNICLILAV